MGSVYYGLFDPPVPATSYWSKLNRSKYYIQLPLPARLGQGFGEANAMGLINLGLARDNTHIHPYCQDEAVGSVINKINIIENDPFLQKEILRYQKQKLDEVNLQFVNMIQEALKKKQNL